MWIGNTAKAVLSGKAERQPNQSRTHENAHHLSSIVYLRHSMLSWDQRAREHVSVTKYDCGIRWVCRRKSHWGPVSSFDSQRSHTHFRFHFAGQAVFSYEYFSPYLHRMTNLAPYSRIIFSKSEDFFRGKVKKRTLASTASPDRSL